MKNQFTIGSMRGGRGGGYLTGEQGQGSFQGKEGTKGRPVPLIKIS